MLAILAALLCPFWNAGKTGIIFRWRVSANPYLATGTLLADNCGGLQTTAILGYNGTKAVGASDQVWRCVGVIGTRILGATIGTLAACDEGNHAAKLIEI